MKMKTKVSSTEAFEKALATASSDRCFLRLYVAGATERSRIAIQRALRLCEIEYKGNCELEVIDVYQQPARAREGQIVATPTLVKEVPRPVRRFIGDLSNRTRLFDRLDLPTGKKTER